MAGGYVGKLLYVDLSSGKIAEEIHDDKFYQDYLGGYGIGARVLFTRQKAGVNALGPDNFLGFVPGLLTGTPALFGSRYTVVGKSPLTGGWGDANSGGDLGPYLKFAGYDAVFFSGISQKPVYLLINDGKAELKDASHLWGKDTNETEDMLKAEVGKDVRLACIGPAGEKQSLISCIINNKGRAAGRSGLGAVMGSKKLKAIAVIGKGRVPLANRDLVNELRKKYLADPVEPYNTIFKDVGTPGFTEFMAHNGDSPVKNWGGVGVVDFPDVKPVGGEAVIARQQRKYGCWGCHVACGGHMKGSMGPYAFADGVHKPEYETVTSFGTLCLNNNLDSIIKANDICNRYGLDTISAGVSIAFAIECYESELISDKDTQGIKLTWGNHAAIVAMIEKLAKREGFGAVLADGVKVAAQRIGKNAADYAMHIGGQEVPMHDPKYGWHWATVYTIDATPARHMQGGEGFVPAGMELPPFDAKSFSGRAPAHKKMACYAHVANSVGMCLFGTLFCMKSNAIADFLPAVTGWDVSMDDLLRTGERIANIRQAFNIREGLNHTKFKMPNRVLGMPPQKAGPLAGVQLDIDTLATEYLKELDWDPKTGKPSKAKLEQLGLKDVAASL